MTGAMPSLRSARSSPSVSRVLVRGLRAEQVERAPRRRARRCASSSRTRGVSTSWRSIHVVPLAIAAHDHAALLEHAERLLRERRVEVDRGG